jgi:hypothetical protein
MVSHKLSSERPELPISRTSNARGECPQLPQGVCDDWSPVSMLQGRTIGAAWTLLLPAVVEGQDGRSF